MRSVDAHGKHLFIRFANGLTIHSHLRMTGKWRVRGLDYKPPRNTWLLIYAGERQVAQINGPILELMTDSRARFDRRLAVLGPDILAPELDEETILRRLRAGRPHAPDRRRAARPARSSPGSGTCGRSRAAGWPRSIPWRRTGDVSDDEVLRILEETRPRMQQSARDGMQDVHRTIYGATGKPCPRCGTTIKALGQGDDNRTTYWCPGCQH